MTVQGVRKVQHAFRKDAGVLTEHLKKVLDTATELSDPRPGDHAETRRGFDKRKISKHLDAYSANVVYLFVNPFLSTVSECRVGS